MFVSFKHGHDGSLTLTKWKLWFCSPSTYPNLFKAVFIFSILNNSIECQCSRTVSVNCKQEYTNAMVRSAKSAEMNTEWVKQQVSLYTWSSKFFIAICTWTWTVDSGAVIGQMPWYHLLNCSKQNSLWLGWLGSLMILLVFSLQHWVLRFSILVMCWAVFTTFLND